MGMFERARKWFKARKVEELPKEAYEGTIAGTNVRAGFAYQRATEGVSAFDLAKNAAIEALKRVGSENFSFALVYSAYEHNPKDVAAGISAAIPGPWLGCTTSGEITSAGLFDDSIVVAAVSSPRIKMGIGVGTNVCKDDIGAGKTAITMALDALTTRGGAMKEGTNYIIMHGSTGGEEGVIRGLQEEVGNIPVVGGTAGNALTENPPYIFANGRAYTDAVVLGLMSSEVITVVDSGHGWKATGRVGLVTKAASPEERKKTLWHKVYTINNRPAAEWYAEQISELKGSEISVETLKQYYPFVTFGGTSGIGGTGYPTGIKDPQGRIWTRDVHSAEADGSLTFWAYVPEGTGLEILEGTPDSMTDKSEASAKELFAKYGKFKPAIMLDYNCVGRKIYLTKVNKLDEEYRNIRKFTKGLPIVGFYTHGEQACYGGLNQHCNLTITRMLLTDTLGTA
jgi:hypothetical protein